MATPENLTRVDDATAGAAVAQFPAVAARPRVTRQTRKNETRNRVIKAARELFDTQGYQGTTIRDIARQAGVSVGSVFTTFASKGDVLSQVMQDRLDGLYAELDRVMPHLRGATLERWPSARDASLVEVSGYPVRIKVSAGRVKVEHDDAARVAQQTGLPLREVVSLAEEAARRGHGIVELRTPAEQAPPDDEPA